MRRVLLFYAQEKARVRLRQAMNKHDLFVRTPSESMAAAEPRLAITINNCVQHMDRLMRKTGP